ncbi:MAG: hypothetical protein WAU86_19110, partial [Oricola sp.]
MTSKIPSGGNAPEVRPPGGSAATDAANLRAILLLSLSMTMFAIDDMFIKLASAEIGVGQILTFQSLAAVVYFVWVARARGDGFTREAIVLPSLLLRQAGEVCGAL